MPSLDIYGHIRPQTWPLRHRQYRKAEAQLLTVAVSAFRSGQPPEAVTLVQMWSCAPLYSRIPKHCKRTSLHRNNFNVPSSPSTQSHEQQVDHAAADHANPRQNEDGCTFCHTFPKRRVHIAYSPPFDTSASPHRIASRHFENATSL